LCVWSISSGSDAAQRSQAAVRAFNKGVEMFNAGQYQNAVSSFDEAISADGDFADAYYARAVCRQKLESPDAAMMDLSDAIRLDPGLLDARSMRGVIHYNADRWDDALED